MSLYSDSESSNSSADHFHLHHQQQQLQDQQVRFGSQVVAPNSPTPYTDATQVRNKCHLIFINRKISSVIIPSKEYIICVVLDKKHNKANLAKNECICILEFNFNNLIDWETIK